ncbi:hypothetical protein PLICRDRAFT_180814 [Plicaturopsis crispa FD-325 SS-3]|uniref:Uncharacterized protein n=1 Tax=Plicaturopsis crispa FD-325 SS-3 TaxID=944288 RepID=A0A0C9SVF3_PLICR|nr:hypothetical protein PLICRDRAFT_180814 [Plicaturopsis crispa FD-325 SS-3]
MSTLRRVPLASPEKTHHEPKDMVEEGFWDVEVLLGAKRTREGWDYKVVVSISAKTAAETYAEGGGGVKLVGGLAIEMEQLGTREPHFTRMRRPGAGFLAKKEWIGSTRMMFWEEHGERMVRTRPQRLKEQKAWEDAVREGRIEYPDGSTMEEFDGNAEEEEEDSVDGFVLVDCSHKAG